MASNFGFDVDFIQEVLAQQLESLQKVLAFNFEASSRLNKARKMPQDVEGVDSGSQDRIGRAEAAADMARMETTSLKQEVETLRIALASARAEASEAKSHAASAAAQVATPSRSSKEDSGGLCRKTTKGEQAITNRGLSEPFLRQDSFSRQDSGTDGEHEEHKAKKIFRRGSIFPDVDKMRDNVRQHLTKEEYNVEDFYKERGFAQAIAKDTHFKNLAFVVIGLNTVWIAIDTDYNKFDLLSQAPMWIQIGENAFCVFFVFEIMMRFLAFNRKLSCFSDGWMMFDTTLVLLMVWETWISPVVMVAFVDDDAASSPDAGGSSAGGSSSSIFRVLRLFRLTRVARLARLLNGMPELMVLIKGMVIAIRSVFSTLLLLMIIIYVFAILLTQMLSETPTGIDQKFQTVPQSMNTLLLQGVFPDQGDAINALLAEDLSYYFILLAYLVIGSLTVMNMLIGVICEVVTVVAQVEKEESTGNEIKQRLSELLPELDKDDDGKISWQEFQAIVDSPLAIQTLDEVGINCVDLVECGPMLFSAKDTHAKNHEDTKIGMEDFIGAVLKFRGDSPATLKDLFELKHIIAKEMTKQLEPFQKTHE